MKYKVVIAILSLLVIILGATTISLLLSRSNKPESSEAPAAPVVSTAITKEEKTEIVNEAVMDAAVAVSNLPLTVVAARVDAVDNSIYVDFSRGGVPQFPNEGNDILISPAVESGVRYEAGIRRLCLRGDFVPGQLYEITIKKGVYVGEQDVPNDFVLRNDAKVSVRMLDAKPNFSVMDNGLIYPKNRKELIFPYSARGVSEFEVEIEHLYDSNLMLYGLSSYPSGHNFKKVASGKLKAFTDKNKTGNYFLDIGSLLPNREPGLYRVRVKSDGKVVERDWYGDEYVSFISDDFKFMLTDLAIQYAHSPGNDKKTYVIVTSLTTGKPVAGAKIELTMKSNQISGRGVTDEKGIALLDVEKEFFNNGNGDYVVGIVAKTDNDLSYLDLDYDTSSCLYYANSSRLHTSGICEPNGFLFAERDICRPGESFESSLFLRSSYNDGLVVLKDTPVVLKAVDAQGNLVDERKLITDKNGFISTTWNVPKGAAIGKWHVMAYVGDIEVGDMSMRIGAYVPDRFKVSMKATAGGERAVKGFSHAIEVEGSAVYYFGEPVAEASYEIDSSFEAAPDPAHWKGWNVCPNSRSGFTSSTYYVKGELENGKFSHKFDSLEISHMKAEDTYVPVRVVFAADVQEPGGRTISSSSYLTFFPTDRFIGIRESNSNMVNSVVFELCWLPAIKGDKLSPSANDIVVSIEKEVWTRNLVKKSETLSFEWTCSMVPITNLTKSVSVPSDGTVIPLVYDSRSLESGKYRIILASSVDPENNLFAVTEHDFWHWSGEVSERSSNPSSLMLTANAQSYAPGDTVELSFKSAYVGNAYLICGETTIDDTCSFSVTQGVNKVSFKLPETVLSKSYYAAISFIPEDPKNTLRLSGLAEIKVDNSKSRRLKVELKAPESIRPDSEVELSVTLSHADGTPASGVVKINAIDEGVAVLTGYKAPNIYRFFFEREFGMPFSMYDFFNYVIPELRIMPDGSFGGDMYMAKAMAGAMRDDSTVKQKDSARFTLALLSVPESGKATVKVKMPDHTGALRLTAVASNDKAVGSAEESVVLRNPISVEISAPRFTTNGDSFTVTATLFNHELAEVYNDKAVSLNFRLKDGLFTVVKDGSVDLPKVLKKGESAVLRFELKANDDSVGAEELAFDFTIGDVKVSNNTFITVRPRRQRDMHVVYEMITNATTIVKSVDGDWIGEYDMSYELFGTPAAGAKEALSWLGNYPYGCVEQVSAAAFPFVIKDDLLKLGLINEDQAAQCTAKMKVAYADILQMRLIGGGYSMWPDGSRPWIYGSLVAMHYIYEARAIGVLSVSDSLYKADLQWLRNITEDVEKHSKFDRAYAAYILGLMGDEGFINSARNIISDEDVDLASFIAASAMLRFGYSSEGTPYFVKAIQGHIWNNFYAGDSRSLGMMLYFASKTGYQNLAELIPLVSLLNANLRSDGLVWGTTEDNSWATLGLVSFASRIEKDETTGQISFDGKEVDFDLAKGSLVVNPTGKNDFTVKASGTLFARKTVFGIPKNPIKKPCPISVSREYYRSNGEVVTNSVSKGELLTVVITLRTPSAIESVVLSDLIPGGFEQEDISLMTRSTLGAYMPKDIVVPDGSFEIRDDRWLWFGWMVPNTDPSVKPYTLVYHIRATTPGHYTIPALVVEDMYDPDMCGVYETDSAIIVE